MADLILSKSIMIGSDWLSKVDLTAK